MRREETKRMAITAVFAALLIIQTFVPNIGYIRVIPALPAITTIPLTIAVYGTLMGPKAGFIFGLFWGITRLIIAYTQPGDMVSLMLFQNPVISLHTLCSFAHKLKIFPCVLRIICFIISIGNRNHHRQMA